MRVVVCGAGVAGMSATHHIAKYGGPDVEVVLLEAEDRLGGHEMPVETPHGLVDLGYMVLNRITYPNIMRFYKEHGVPLDKTDMSFAIQHRQYDWSFTFNIANYARLFATPAFWSFVSTKNRFHGDALGFLKQADSGLIDPVALRQTLEQFCRERAYSDAFVTGWLSPFCQAVWSTPPTMALQMEAYTILSFLRNHGFLSWTPIQWYTPKGRSKITINTFERLLAEHKVETRVNARVVAVRDSTSADGTKHTLVVELASGDRVFADHVVFATPSGTVLPTLTNATPLQKEILPHFRGNPNHVVLHTNPALMPRQRRNWASWNVLDGEKADSTVLTYWVRPLQHIPVEHLFITLNAPPEVYKDSDKLVERWTTHPVIDVASTLASRRVWTELQGDANIWFAGAYLHYGFHEDGFRSGIEVARLLLKNKSIPLLPITGEAFHPTHFAFRGKTVHIRFDPEDGKVVHKFQYSLSYDYINIDSKFRAWWGGLYREDHFGDPEVPLTEAVRELVCKQTGVYPSGPVDLVTHLREWGYCFNPIALFICWDTEARGKVEYVVSEVTNTPWGERSVQVLDMAKARKGEGDTLVIEKPKTLHVSPFNPMPDSLATWRYTFRLPTSRLENLRLVVELFEKPDCTRRKIYASMDLTNAGKAPTTWRGPIPAALVVQFWIHFQAVILFSVKRLPFYENLALPSTQAFDPIRTLGVLLLGYFLLFSWLVPMVSTLFA